MQFARMLSELGEFARGLGYLEETAEICEARENWWGLAFVLHARGLIHLRRGDFRGAIPLLEEGVEVCRSRRHFRALIPTATANLGYGYALAGRPAEGLLLLEEALRDAERLEAAWSQALWFVWLGEAHLLAGRMDAAVGQQALDLATQRKERGQEAYARRLLGEITSREGSRSVAEAVRHYSQAMSLADELGMRPLVAHCHLGMGRLYRGIGQRQGARAHLTIAATMYREMDMSFWPKQAQVELAEMG